MISGTGSGNFTISGSNSYTGATNINAGTLTLGAANRISDSSALTVASGATFNMNSFNETVASTSGAGNITLGSATLTTGDTTDTTFSGVISGTGSLTKVGSGTFTLAGSNTYSGATNINVGTLTLGAANRIADSSAVTIGFGATFNLASFNETISSLSGTGNVTLGSAALITGDASNTAYSGVISGTGSVTKVGSGIFTLLGSNTYTGATNVNVGTLALGAANRISDSSALTVATGATFDLASFNETVASTSGTGNIALGSGTFTTGDNSNTAFSGVISGSGGVTKQGSGIFTIYGDNTYTGATNVNAGTLALGAANRISDSSALTVASGATFDLANFNETVASTAGAGNITLGSAAFTTGDTSNTAFSGVMSGSGSVTKVGSGTFTVSGANTYTGATNVNAGTLALGAANSISDSSALTVASGATFNLASFNETVASTSGAGNITLGSASFTTGDASDTTFSGVMSGSGSLTKVGSGIFTLSGANTYSGATNVNAGTVTLGAANRISDSSALNVATGATFNLNNFNETLASVAGAGNITLGSATLATGDDSNTTFAGVLSGSGSLIKQGTGSFTLSGNNTFTGGTTINAGSAIANSSTALGTNNATVSTGATLQINGGFTIANNLYLNGTGASGTGGALIANGSNATVSGTINLVTNSTIGTALSSDSLIFDNNSVVTGSGALTKSGLGTATLSGNNTYTSGTTVAAGTLIANHNAALGSNAATVNSGATLQINGGYTIANTLNLNGGGAAGSGGALTGSGSNIVISGAVNLASDSTVGTASSSDSIIFSGTSVIDGSSNISKSGLGTVTLSGTNTYSGATYINAGKVIADNNFALGTIAGATNIASGATLEISGNSIDLGSEALNVNGGTLASVGDDVIVNNVVTLGASSTILVNGSTGKMTIANLITDDINTYDINKTGAGTLFLPTANTYNGTTTLTAGTLLIGHDNALGGVTGGNLIMSGGTLEFSGTSINLPNNISLANNVSFGGTTDITLSGNVTGINFTKSGDNSLILSGTNNFTGTIGINSGTLSIISPTALGASASGITVNSGGTLNLNAIALGNVAITLNGGSLTGTGVASLDANVTLTGDSFVHNNGGSFTFNGMIDGAKALQFDGTGTTYLLNHIGSVTPLTSIKSNTALNINVAGGTNVKTTGSQEYNNTVTLGTDTTFSTSGDNGTHKLAFNGNISGGKNIILQGTSLTGAPTYEFTLNGGIEAASMNVTTTSNSLNNKLTVNSGVDQNFNITGTNIGDIGGITTIAGTFNFNNIHNLTGGSKADKFTLKQGAKLSGQIDGGAGNNTLFTDNNVLNSWNITANNTGTVTGVGGGFIRVQNLMGGTARDDFRFAAGANVTSIHGGNDVYVKANTLEESNTILFSSTVKLTLNPMVAKVISAGVINNAGGTTNFDAILSAISTGTGSTITFTDTKGLKYGPNTTPNSTKGSFGDPFYFEGFTMTNPPPLDVAPIIEQPNVDTSTVTNTSYESGGPTGVDNNTLTDVLPSENSTVGTGAMCK